MEKKSTLCVIFGGRSTEYEVSLRSVSTLLNHLNREKYNLHIIGITKKGKWYLFQGEEKTIINDTWENEKKTEINLSINEGAFLTEDGKKIKPNKVFVMMHGEDGEDGKIQAMLELARIKYVGCDSFSSALCMDKELAKKIANGMGISVANDIVINKNDYDIKNIISRSNRLGYPLFVKTARGGSSVGVRKTNNEKELKKAIRELFNLCPKLIIEKYIKGSEIEVAVLEKNGEIIAIGCGQIKYTSEFYDYNSKYKCDQNQYVIPANIDTGLRKKLFNIAKRLFFAFGCSDLSRIDFFITEQGKIIFNEINTLPGFTSISMYPMIMEKQGISVSHLIDKLLS